MKTRAAHEAGPNRKCSRNLKRFKQRFDIYLEASGASEKSAKQKTCILLHVEGVKRCKTIITSSMLNLNMLLTMVK